MNWLLKKEEPVVITKTDGYKTQIIGQARTVNRANNRLAKHINSNGHIPLEGQQEEDNTVSRIALENQGDGTWRETGFATVFKSDLFSICLALLVIAMPMAANAQAKNADDFWRMSPTPCMLLGCYQPADIGDILCKKHQDPIRSNGNCKVITCWLGYHCPIHGLNAFIPAQPKRKIPHINPLPKP